MFPASVSSIGAAPTPATARRLDGAAVRRAIIRCRVTVDRHAAWLTRLDAVLGDGDHGDNLSIGFRAAQDTVDLLPDGTPPGAILRAVGHRLVAAVGGASGPLYGTAFLEAGHLAGDDPELPPATVAAMLTAAADAVARRGRCSVGDKTILDALAPAAAAFASEAASATDAAVDGASLRLVRAGVAGARSTRALVARRGLALRLGARSAGHLDPGAVSCALLLRALAAR